MEWLLPYYYCAVALSAAGIPMPMWSSIGVPLPEPAAPCGDPSALDVELVLVLYEVLVEQADCDVCGAPLNPAVSAELAQSPFTAGRIIVATRCRGPNRHRQVAKVVERNGELRFGRLKARS